MVADGSPPVSPVFLILPFKDFFDAKLPGIAGFFLVFREITKVDNPKAAAADVRYRLSGVQLFPPGDTFQNAVKMDRLAGIFVRDGRGKILDGFTAPGAIQRGQGLGG
jgi:hypothetical protein